MKKVFAVGLVLALLLCCSACGGGKNAPVTKFDVVGDWQCLPDGTDPLELGSLYTFTGWGMAYIDNYIDVAQAYCWFWVDGKLELAAADGVSFDEDNRHVYTPDAVYAPVFDKDGALHLTSDDGKELVLTRAFDPEELGNEPVGRYVHDAEAGDLIYEFYPDGRALLIREDLGNWVYSLRWTYDAVSGVLVCDAYDNGSVWDTVTYNIKLDKDTLAIVNADGSELVFNKE